MSKVQISKEKFIHQVNDERMSAKELADFYGLPVTQIRRILKTLDLKIKRKFQDKFELVDEIKDEIEVELQNTDLNSNNMEESVNLEFDFTETQVINQEQTTPF